MPIQWNTEVCPQEGLATSDKDRMRQGAINPARPRMIREASHTIKLYKVGRASPHPNTVWFAHHLMGLDTWAPVFDQEQFRFETAQAARDACLKHFESQQ